MRRFEVAGSGESKEEIYGRRDEKKMGWMGPRRLAEASRPHFLWREQPRGQEEASVPFNACSNQLGQLSL